MNTSEASHCRDCGAELEVDTASQVCSTPCKASRLVGPARPTAAQNIEEQTADVAAAVHTAAHAEEQPDNARERAQTYTREYVHDLLMAVGADRDLIGRVDTWLQASEIKKRSDGSRDSCSSRR